MNSSRERRRFWQYARGLAAPLLLWVLFVGVLVDTLRSRLRGDDPYDEAALREWIEEARVFRENLPGLVQDYLRSASPEESQANADKILEQLSALGDITKMYQGQMPLFPTVYRLELAFNPPRPHRLAWDSLIPRQTGQVRHLVVAIHDSSEQTANLHVDCVMHAFNKRQRDEQAATQRLRGVALLAILGTLLAFLWIYLVQRRQREREQQRALAQQQIHEAERRLLQEELRREEAERLHEETGRKLLEQQLATQAAERQALELKSQLYASIGIMAGSYAHNIKNLLVRPNDLLRRCLEENQLSQNQAGMLQEVKETLGTVTERLQQILRTVRRDPTRSEFDRLDLNAVVRYIHRTWDDLALEKWKLELRVELCGEPLWLEGDLSHLHQAIENLLFNARDATFEMRGHLRAQARYTEELTLVDRRQAVIAAAGWKGAVWMRTRKAEGKAVLEVQDNGIGMIEEVRRRCTETHFSTKRHNAIYEGNTTGMGLGLAFVVAILEHHRAALEIVSAPNQGALFRVRFPLEERAPVTALVTG